MNQDQNKQQAENEKLRPLGREQIHAITRIQTGYLAQRLADRDISIEFSEEALDLIGEAGFDPVYGARPLKRAIQSRIENPLAQEILRGRFGPGDTIQVGVQDGKFTFEKVKEAA